MKTRGPRNTMIRDDVLRKAAGLFVERGFTSTNLEDIAKAVGLSRPALYYYFKNKDDVLTALVEEATTYPVAVLEKHRRSKEHSPSERLRLAIRELVLWIIDTPTPMRVLETNEAKLPARVATQHAKAKRRVLDAFADMITDGIKAGELVHVDPQLAAFALIGMCNWTAWWYTPEGPKKPEEIANLYADMAIRSLQASGSPSNRAAARDDIGAALDALRQDVAHLERIIEFRRKNKLL